MGKLPLPVLLHGAKQSHIFSDLGTTSLLSLDQLCDAGCSAMFDATACNVQCHDQMILQGPDLLHVKSGTKTGVSSGIEHHSLTAIA
jgi:hypothetical protein